MSGIRFGDRVILNVDAGLEMGVMAQPVVAKAADTLTVRLCNVTAGAIDPAPRPFSYIVLR